MLGRTRLRPGGGLMTDWLLIRYRLIKICKFWKLLAIEEIT